MSLIQLQRSHQLGSDQIKIKVNELVDNLSKELQLNSKWESDSNIRFNRKGAKGELKFDESSLEITIRLGMMFRALKAPIESEINATLDRFLD